MQEIYADAIGRIWSSDPVFKLELVSRCVPEISGDSLRIVAVLVLPKAAIHELTARLVSINSENLGTSMPTNNPAADDTVYVTLQTIES